MHIFNSEDRLYYLYVPGTPGEIVIKGFKYYKIGQYHQMWSVGIKCLYKPLQFPREDKTGSFLA